MLQNARVTALTVVELLSGNEQEGKIIPPPFLPPTHLGLKPLTILAKRSILDAWLFPKWVSVGGYNTVSKIQTEISPWQQVRMESF